MLLRNVTANLIDGAVDKAGDELGTCATLTGINGEQVGDSLLVTQ